MENQKTILIIEDDVFMAELLVQELTGAGFKVLVAKNGKDGFSKFKEESPDLIVLDVLLPDQRGFEVLRQIRREGGADAKVIILSNLSEEHDKEEARRLGVVDYLVKANTSLPEIIDKIRAQFSQ